MVAIPPEIGILGGGISGLVLGSLLKNSEVLEKEDVPGGLCRSVREEGFTFDLGSHIIFSKDRKALNFLLHTVAGNSIEHRRNTKILYNGRLVKYPFENGLSDLPRGEALECALGYLFRESKSPGNFKEWMLSRFGKAIVERYLLPYNRKLWCMDPSGMDCSWVGRVPQPPAWDVLKSSLGFSSEGYTHQLYFRYPRKGGFQAVTDSLSRSLGERVSTGFGVGRIRKIGDGFEVVSKGGERRTYKKLVSTIPLPQFLHSYENAPKEVVDAADSLRYTSASLVMLGLRGRSGLSHGVWSNISGPPHRANISGQHTAEKGNGLHWVYVPDGGLLPNRMSFPSNYSPYNAPAGCSSILAEITYPKGSKPEDALGKTVSGLEERGFLKEGEVVFSKEVELPYAYVVYDLGHRKNVERIRGFCEGEGITLLGRFGEFEYYNTDACVKRAIETAALFY